MAGLVVELRRPKLQRYKPVEDRLRYVERRLAEGRHPSKIRAELSDAGISPRQSRRYVAVAQARLAREASELTRDQWRGQLVIMATETHRAALDRKRPLVVSDGSESGSHVELHPDPDLVTANQTLRTLAILTGNSAEGRRGDVNVSVNNNNVSFSQGLELLATHFLGPAAAAAALPAQVGKAIDATPRQLEPSTGAESLPAVKEREATR